MSRATPLTPGTVASRLIARARCSERETPLTQLSLRRAVVILLSLLVVANLLLCLVYKLNFTLGVYIGAGPARGFRRLCVCGGVLARTPCA